MIVWNAEDVCRIGRERCGGATFLYINQIGEQVHGTHSGMTAEGDNKVLMQKVVKDILSHSRKGKHQSPNVPKDALQEIALKKDVSDFETLATLIMLRESFEVKSISKFLEKSIFQEGKEFFEVWMYHANE